MNLFESMAAGFSTALALHNVLYCFLGVFLGTFIGVLPGIGSLAAVSLLLPVTYYLDPTTSLVLLAGVYYGAEYGGSTAAILLNLPGTPSSAVTCLDGHPMARQGRAGVALFTTTLASFIGGSIGIAAMMAFSPMLSELAYAFGPAEYFSLMAFALVASASITQGEPIKGLAMVVMGLLLGCVGLDLNSGHPRLSFGFYELYQGVSLVAVAMGLFGISEVIASIGIARDGQSASELTLRKMIPSRSEIERAAMPVLRGSGIGGFFGALPGTGQTVASFLSYAVEKRISKDPSRFGKGAIEGIAAPEAANNAAVQTSFIPTLTVGVPGSATMALMLGALMVHGITPGPLLITQHADIFWALVASFWIGNVLLLVLNIPLIGIWVRLLRIPYNFLFPGIVLLICIGVYSVNNSLFDVGIVFLFGMVGYAMRLISYEPAPLVIALVLGPLMEQNLGRAFVLAHGDLLAIASRPISGFFLTLALLMVVWTLWKSFRSPRRQAV